MKLKTTVLLLMLPVLAACGQPAQQPSVHFVQPQDGAQVGQQVTVVMAVQGMKAHKAGELIEGTGHHHLIIDGAPVAKGEGVPKDDRHKHFGKGQSETVIQLSPGTHTLTLQFADGHHRSYGPSMSQTITVHVK